MPSPHSAFYPQDGESTFPRTAGTYQPKYMVPLLLVMYKHLTYFVQIFSVYVYQHLKVADSYLSHSREYAALSWQPHTEMSFVFNQISGRTTQFECFKINSNHHDFHYIFISAADAVRHCVTRLKQKNITGNVIMDRLIE